MEIVQAMRREFARWDDIDVHRRGTSFTSGGQGFAAMSRKRLLAILQARCAELGVQVRFRTEAPDAADLPPATTWWWPPTERTRYPGAVRRDVRARPGPAAQQVHLAGHRPGLRRVQVLRPGHPGRDHAGAWLPVQRPASTFILEMHEDVWGRAGFTEAPGLAPGRSDEASIERIRDLCADMLGGPAAVRQQLAVDHLHHGPVRDVAARERGAARRRRAHGALLHRLGHQAGHGGRAGPGRVPA